MTHTQFLSNKYAKQNALYRIINGKGKYYHNGKWISEAKMDRIYPTPVIISRCETNPDRSTLWMADEKSY